MRLSINRFNLILLFFVPCLMNCNGKQLTKNIDLNGKWEIVDFRLPGIGGVSKYEAQEQVGKIASINSNVMYLVLLNKKFKFKIDIDSSKVVMTLDYPLFNPKDEGSINCKDFKLSSKILIFKTIEISRRKYYDFDEIVMDKDGKRIVVNWDGAIFLLIQKK